MSTTNEIADIVYFIHRLATEENRAERKRIATSLRLMTEAYFICQKQKEPSDVRSN